MKRILVTGAGGSAAFNFVDALRLAERDERFHIVGCDVKRYHLPLTCTNRNYLVPPVSDPRYLDVLNQIIRAEKIDLVHAQPDVEVEFLSRNGDRVDARLFLPASQTIALCQDKMALTVRLRDAGVPVPDARLLRSETDLDAVATLVARHGKVWIRAIRGAGARASLPVREVRHAAAWIDYWTTMRGIGYGDFMASEFLPGREFAFQSLWKDGRLITAQARERVEYIFGHLTPSGQTSSPSVARTVHRADVNEIATRAVQAADSKATGVFCVDLKESVSGMPKVTEINAGRFFTTSNFFAHAGLNMPYLYVKLALGEPLPSLPLYDGVAADCWWVRMIDMGFALVEDDQWNCREP